MYKIDYTSYRAVKNYNRRVRFLVMHYTALDFKNSISALTGESVSAHYLIPDLSDKTYSNSGFKDMRIFNLVDECDRSWHAGVSSWRNRRSINDTSIGIEIVNLSTDDHGKCVFHRYGKPQIEAVKELSLNILQRYPDITPTNVVGHSDISPGRKSDPGAAFPWKELYDAGIGAWYDENTVSKYLETFNKLMPSKVEIVGKLKEYGYDISNVGTRVGYKNLIRAFQLHFRQSKYDGSIDAETAAIIFALVEKYYY